jgi:predicted amidohydrolase
LKSGEAIYNTGFCFQNGDVDQFYKLSLTESEKNFFSIPDHPTSKVFNVKGFKLGLLICFEAEISPYQNFDEGSVDVILWPGYWGWTMDDNWSSHKKNGEENKIFKNMSEWKIPLIQANFSFNDLNDYRASGPHGLSVFVNSDNQLMGQGGFEEEAYYLIALNKVNGIQSIETLFI